MPIRKENVAAYPVFWRALRRVVLARATSQCEGTPHRPWCRALNYMPHPDTGAKVVLTIAHMDHELRDHGLANLRALCQKCHNAWDAQSRAEGMRARRRDAARKNNRQQEIDYG